MKWLGIVAVIVVGAFFQEREQHTPGTEVENDRFSPIFNAEFVLLRQFRLLAVADFDPPEPIRGWPSTCASSVSRYRTVTLG